MVQCFETAVGSKPPSPCLTNSRWTLHDFFLGQVEIVLEKVSPLFLSNTLHFTNLGVKT